MKTLTLALILIAPLSLADTTLSAVGTLSNGLGYERLGAGIQIDNRQRHGDWGWSVQGMALSHAKVTGKGQRFQAIGMGRRFFGQHFVEAGGQWRGYQSTFPDGTQWKKYGTAPGLGIGTIQQGAEFKLRFFFPDTTMNLTDMVAASVDIPMGDWVIGGTVEQWRFDIGSERLSGTQAMIRFGYRF